MRKTMFEMAAEIVKTQCRSNVMSPDEIISSLHVTYRTLQSLQSAKKQGVQITEQTGVVDYITHEKI